MNIPNIPTEYTGCEHYRGWTIAVNCGRYSGWNENGSCRIGHAGTRAEVRRMIDRWLVAMADAS